MELKRKNNLWLWLYRYFTRDGEEPTSICPLFWGGVLGAITWLLSPLSNLLLYILYYSQEREVHKDYKQSFIEWKGFADVGGIAMVIFNILILLIYFGGYLLIMGLILDLPLTGSVPWWVWIASLFIIPIGITVLIAIAYGGIVFFKYIFNATVSKVDQGVLKVGATDWYNKVCTRITWK